MKLHDEAEAEAPTRATPRWLKWTVALIVGAPLMSGFTGEVLGLTVLGWIFAAVFVVAAVGLLVVAPWWMLVKSCLKFYFPEK